MDRVSKDWGNYKNWNIHIVRISEGKRKTERNRGISESIMTKDYLNQCQTPNCRSRKHREHQAGKEKAKIIPPNYHLQMT